MTLNLELDPDTMKIVAAERKVKRGKERLAEDERALDRYRDDRELFNEPTSAEQLRQLEARRNESVSILARLERELDEARQAPERRRIKDKRGAELLAEAKLLDADVRATAERLAALVAKAQPLVHTIRSEFVNERASFERPFRGSDLVHRLAYWAEDDKPGDFLERLARFRGMSR